MTIASHAIGPEFDSRLKYFLHVEKFFQNEATNGIRTHDLSLTKRVLYQLSYSGVYVL